MNDVLRLLLSGETLDRSQMAQVLGVDEASIDAQMTALEKSGVLLGWRPVLNPEVEEDGLVRAAIEVRITPERGGGFDRLAERISKFDEVESCYLMSGGFDLLVFVKGRSLQRVASFVSERLATIEGVLSTATHFVLRAYKEQGYLIKHPESDTGRLSISP
ncbi:MAG: Lrp/AsnC family transcriptional regulator [Opitutaceae bacterium]